jgi:hypothetical protein
MVSRQRLRLHFDFEFIGSAAEGEIGWKRRNDMANGSKRSKAGSAAGLKAGKGRSSAKKANLRDLDAKDTKSVRGGDLMSSCATGKHIDKVIITT